MIQKREDITGFLTSGRIAMVGVSREENDFSRDLFRRMEKTGYTMIPVHHEADAIGERPCFRRVQDVDPAPEAALLMLPKERAESALLDCIEAGVKRVWVYGITGPRELDASVLELAAQHDIQLVAGYCPHMFLEDSAFIHKLHGAVWKLVGLYPK